MQLLKSSLLTVGAACLFCLSLSFNANAADSRAQNKGRQLGDWQEQGQGMDEVRQGFNQDQRCCPQPIHKEHTKFHEDQYKGGTRHRERSHMETLNTIVTKTQEDVENRTEGCTDTEDQVKKIEKKGCVPCDCNGNPL